MNYGFKRTTSTRKYLRFFRQNIDYLGLTCQQKECFWASASFGHIEVKGMPSRLAFEGKIT